jgi:hypothetical protein
MARKVVDLHPEAIAEGREARLWYSLRSRRAEDRFRLALRRAINSIRDAPERWPADEQGLRQYRLRGFPYRLIYWTEGDPPSSSRLRTANGGLVTGRGVSGNGC